ncbi:MAG TPA: LysE family translocator [bacterium]|nr:LysE family translocator [bacterium]
MVSFGTLALYIPAVLLMVLTPGPAILLTLNRSLSFGRRAGLVTAAGLLSGTCLLQASAALGLTVVLQASGVAYEALKIAGALYLTYLGVRTFLAGADDLTRARRDGPRPSSRRHYLGGIATELLNPKTAMFYVSILPQFVDVGAGRVTTQLFLLGAIFVVFATCSLAAIVMTSTHVRSLLVRRPGIWTIARRVTGCVFIGFGARLALEPR